MALKQIKFKPTFGGETQCGRDGGIAVCCFFRKLFPREYERNLLSVSGNLPLAGYGGVVVVRSNNSVAKGECGGGGLVMKRAAELRSYRPNKWRNKRQRKFANLQISDLNFCRHFV